MRSSFLPKFPQLARSEEFEMALDSFFSFLASNRRNGFISTLCYSWSIRRALSFLLLAYGRWLGGGLSVCLSVHLPASVCRDASPFLFLFLPLQVSVCLSLSHFLILVSLPSPRPPSPSPEALPPGDEGSGADPRPCRNPTPDSRPFLFRAATRNSSRRLIPSSCRVGARSVLPPS